MGKHNNTNNKMKNAFLIMVKLIFVIDDKIENVSSKNVSYVLMFSENAFSV